MHARNYFENDILEENHQKAWKNNYFFVLMDKIYKNKGNLELVTGSSSDYKTSSEKFLY